MKSPRFITFVSLLIIGIVLCAARATKAAGTDAGELEPYRRQLYAELAAKHLPHGSLAEAIAFQRLVIRISFIIHDAVHKRMAGLIEALPGRTAAILRHRGCQRSVTAALPAIMKLFNDLLRVKQRQNDVVYAFVGPLQKHAGELLVRASADPSVGVRIGALFAGQKAHENQSISMALRHIERIMRNFHLVAARRGTRPGTCVALVRLAADEITDALQDHDNATVAYAKKTIQGIEEILRQLEEQENNDDDGGQQGECEPDDE